MNAGPTNDLAHPFFAVTDYEIDASAHTVALAGDVDLYTAPQFKSNLVGLIERGKTRIVVDLTDAHFIDSTTLGVLVGAMKRIRKGGGKLVVVCPDEDMRRLFDLTGLDHVFSIFDDRRAAIEAVRAA
jgi:anti-sigma B factor antagonist